MAGPWEKYGGGASAGDPVIAPPDPYKQANEARAQQDQGFEQQRVQFEQERLRLAQQEAARKADEDARKAQDERTKAERLTNAQSGAIDNLVRVINKIDQVYADAGDNNGWFETGASGALMRKVGPSGTAAYDLAQDIQTIDANSAFSALQAMRDASPTGGALGSITERELDLLKSTIANLDPNQSQDQFIRNLGEAKGAYIQMLRRVDPAKADEIEQRGNPVTDQTGNVTYDERAREAIGGTEQGNPPSGGGGGYSLDSIANALKAGVGDIVEGAGGLVAMPGNAANAAINAAFGTNLSTDLAGDLRSELGLPENPNRFAAAINQGGAGALSGAGAARGLATIANPGAYQNALMTVGRTPIRDMVAGGGAGFGSEALKDYGPLAQAAGAIGGGMLGYGGANALLRAGAPRSPTPIAQAAERQSVDLLPADVGGRGTRIVTSAARSSPFSANRVEQGAQRTQDQLASATKRVARSQGDASNLDVAGQNVRAAAERFSRQTSERAARLYDRAYEASKGIKIKPLRTVAALDDEIARLKQNPDPAAASTLRELTAFRDNVAGGVSVQGLRDARTSLSQGVYDGKLRSGADQARYKSILNNVATDISDGLRQAGREDAANMFSRADEFWKARVEHIDEVLQPILGKSKSGEDIVSTIEGMTRGKQGGAMRLSRLLSNMTDEEAGSVRATIVDRLGKSTAGQQNAEGTAFSASTFLTNWNKMTPQAKASLFADKQMRRDLNDIAMLAEGTKASQALNNSSNTGAAFMGSAMGNMAVTSLPKMVVGAAVQAATGRLMASPKFARWLARAPKNPEAARKWTEQLGVLAGRESALAADARSLQQYLQQSLGQSPSARVAAEEEE